MSTLAVTCPEDGAQFAVVEPEVRPESNVFTVTCPSCHTRIPVTYPDLEHQNEDKSSHLESIPSKYGPFLGEVHTWTLTPGEDAPDPYTGSDREIPTEQYVVAEVGGLGGAAQKVRPDDEELTDTGEEGDIIKLWYTPDHHDEGGDSIAYVVRAAMETGVKTKNVYQNDAGELYVKNRGVPRDSDKQWTYLDRDECYARAQQARLPAKVYEDATSDKENRYNIFLNEEIQPLVNDDGELAENLVLELARTLAAFQSKRSIGG